ncbi:MAG: lipid kinase [Bacteroidaceae bacterium]|nr:lipid kinase [Bacteroidaceae bacterium]
MVEESRWGVIYNAPSVTFGNKRWNTIRKYIDQKGVQYDFVQSENASSVERLVNMLCDNGYHTIIIVGNDGALNQAINAIMQKHDQLPSDFALGVVPDGVGNDFARFWGLSVDDYRKAVDCLIQRRTRKVDVGECTYCDAGEEKKRYFLNCINIGYGARLVKISNDAHRIIGSKRLSMIPIALRQIFERKSFDLKMQIDTESVDRQYMSVCISNCLGYGQTPNGVPYNGMIDISAITRPLWWQLFEGFWLLGKGRFLNYRNVHPYRAQVVKIEETGKALVTLDSCELPEHNTITPIKVTIRREFINFIVNYE